jgi:hypothetical protein
VLSVIGLAPVTAAAGDGIRPRTIVLWPDDVPCSITALRAIDPIVHLSYAIAAEDPPAGEAITQDEVADGRRHQFFAFASDIDPRIAMPEWIAPADVMAAADMGLVDPAVLEPDDVLETHGVLADTFVRIDPDDARRPITFAAAEAGVDWDTTGLSTGAWVVRAYTWDPWPSRWAAPRPGVVAIADDADPGSHAPAHAVQTASEVLHRDEVAAIEGCISAMDGTTVTGEWTFFDDIDAAWVPFVEDVPVEGNAFALAFAPPESLWGRFAVLRVTATDPLDRVYIAYVQHRVTVLASDRPQDCDPIEDACDTDNGSTSGSSDGAAADATSSSQTGESSSTSGNATSSAPAEDEHANSGAGCSCAADHETGGLVLVALTGFTYVASRRRKRITTRAQRRWNSGVITMDGDRGRCGAGHRSVDCIGQHDGLGRAAAAGRRAAVAREG